MSSAANHRKRSHRSEYRSRAFCGGGRQSIITPSVQKKASIEYIRQLRLFHNTKRRTQSAEETEA